MLHNEHRDNGAEDVQPDDSGAEEKGEAAPPALATLAPMRGAARVVFVKEVIGVVFIEEVSAPSRDEQPHSWLRFE